MARYTASMPLLPSALPPKGEARRYVANDFLNLIALPLRGRLTIWESDAFSHYSLIPAFKFRVVYVIYLFKASIAAAASIVTPKGRIDSSMEKLAL